MRSFSYLSLGFARRAESDTVTKYVADESYIDYYRRNTMFWANLSSKFGLFAFTVGYSVHQQVFGHFGGPFTATALFSYNDNETGCGASFSIVFSPAIVYFDSVSINIGLRKSWV